MKIKVHYSGEDCSEYNLNGDEIRALLLCNEIGHNGSTYNIKARSFEECGDEYTVSVITEKQ
jgi:hypothetical protein